MTEEMLALANANKAKAGVENVEFLKGTIEDVPPPDAAVDAVISNCVINLSTDKPAVLAEMFRVLTPGGRIGMIFKKFVLATAEEPQPIELRQPAEDAGWRWINRFDPQA